MNDSHPTVPAWVYERWTKLASEEELEGYRKGGFGGRVGIGERPALIVIDMTKAYVDPRFAMAHGPGAQAIVPAVANLLHLCREERLPVFFARPTRRSPTERGLYSRKTISWNSPRSPEADEWPDEIAPKADETIIDKPKSSVFHETPLRSMLTHLEVDTVVLVGLSTSGCIRSAAEAAFSCNFRPIIPEECVADRSPRAHQSNLFDIDMKYGDVMPVGDVFATLAASGSS